jgi:16S rRNA (uracil1498-N3)-methyltransferase
MHRFYLAPEYCQDEVLSLTGREAHHAQHVLRLRRGEQVQVLDGEGQVLECEVAELKRGGLELRVVERRSVAALPYRVTLAQALPKGKLFESIVQKATELGAYRIVPLITQRVVAKLEQDTVSEKLEKWRLVAIEAIKQCGSTWLPRIEPPETIEQFRSRQSGMELALVGSLGGDSRHPGDCFSNFVSQHGTRPKSVSVAIGPEGDFTPGELAALQLDGAHPITLGPLVLRTDTAAIYCLSIINYELQVK